MKGAYDMAKLLIADDLVPIRQMVRITLSTQGWTILEAENGQKALEIARAERPDLMLLDVDMGAGPNGFDVCRELKSAEETKGIPIVMLTAHDSESDRAGRLRRRRCAVPHQAVRAARAHRHHPHDPRPGLLTSPSWTASARPRCIPA